MLVSQNVKYMPGSKQMCFGFCFLPTNLVGVLLQHFEDCVARAVVVL